VKKLFGIAALVTLLAPAGAYAGLPKTDQCAPYNQAEASSCGPKRSGLYLNDDTLDLHYLVRGTEWLELTGSSTTLTFQSDTATTIAFTPALSVAGTFEAAAGLSVSGVILGTSNALSVAGTATFSSSITVVSQTIGIPFNDMRVHDNLAALLPVAAAADDMGNVPGTVGTVAPSLQGVDFGGGASDEKATFSFVMPSSYSSGSTVTLRFLAGMLITVADAAATLDAECWVPDYANADGSVSGDLVTPAAQSINSLTLADIDFVVDDDASGHVLAAGSVVQCRISFAGSDTGNLGTMIPIIRKIDVIIST
jgi:hypothetical protein